MSGFTFSTPTCCSKSQWILKPWWTLAGCCGMRRLGRLLTTLNPQAYRDTLFYFNTPEPVVALTIDDGLCRGSPASSMTLDVIQLLERYQAHATFFVCTEYLPPTYDNNNNDNVVQSLLDHGHELGNHLHADKLWYYPKLPPDDFQEQLQNTNAILEQLEEQYQRSSLTTTTTNSKYQPCGKTRWFRAPQGIMTAGMRTAVQQQQGHMIHVLGDCYCDDWCFAQEVDPLFSGEDDNDNDNGDDNNHDNDNDATTTIILNAMTKQVQHRQARRETIMQQVAKIMLHQVQRGSIAILHMPEKGFRQGNLLALEYFLQGIHEKGWKCVNLTEMQQLCQRQEQQQQPSDDYQDTNVEDTI